MTVIETINLTKEFKGKGGRPPKKAVDNLNLKIESGEIFGFLGPNGAGKTTTINIILGFLFPTAGEVKLFGESPFENAKVKYKVGYMPEVSYYYRYMRAGELLDAYGRLFGLSKNQRSKRIEELLAMVGLLEERNTYLREFSKGMLQRFSLAQALINDPELLILDEPTTGLDPLGRKEMRDIILRLHKAGKTIFFSSHELSAVELVCTRIGILHQGKLVLDGELNSILGKEYGMKIEVTNANEQLIDLLTPMQVLVSLEGNRATITLNEKKRLFPLLQILEQAGVQIEAITPLRKSLEDVFIKALQGESVNQ